MALSSSSRTPTTTRCRHSVRWRRVGGFRATVDPHATHPETPGVSPVRSYEVGARSTDVFGRVLWSCRDQHFVADGPVHNGCPGEAVTPAELFLAGIASCGVAMLAAHTRRKKI